MRTSLATLALAGVLLFVFAVAQARRCPDVPAMTAAARNGDAHAIEELRSYGPGGLKSFIECSQEDLERYRASAAEGAGRFGAGDRWEGLVKAIDAIAGQYDAAWSELYWFTNLEEAKELAQRSGKPILSLRLLGRLDEELSCANSRFFRSTLYANETVAALLRDRFILHWESVRPAPVITIDYGDGRTLKTTITGNSIHYVLTPDGKVVDALPGLWSPEDFAEAIEAADAEVQSLHERGSADGVAGLRMIWNRQLAAIEQDRRALGIFELRLNGGDRADLPIVLAAPRPAADLAEVVTTSKRVAERPMLAGMGAFREGIDRTPHAAQWERLAQKLPSTPLAGRSRSLLRAELLQGGNPSDPRLIDEPIAKFQGALKVDSLRNRLGLRRDVLSMLTKTPELGERLTDLNNRVYAEVFLTPDSDPWLGMYEPSTFTGLWGGPAHEAPTQQAMLAR